MIKEVEEL